MNRIITLILFLNCNVYAGLFGPTISVDDEIKIERAITNNNLDAVKNLIGNKDISKYDQFLDYALAQPPLKKYVCRNDIISYLVSKGVKPSQSTETKYRKNYTPHKRIADISQIISNSCSKALKRILDHINPKDLASGSLSFDFINQMNDAKKRHYKADRLGDRILEVYSIIDNENKKNCHTGIIESCKAQKHLDNQIAKLRNLSKSIEFSKTPKATLQKACSAFLKTKAHRSFINKQKRISAVSGTINLKERHNSGKRIIELEDQIQRLQEKYKRQTGKLMNLSTCK